MRVHDTKGFDEYWTDARFEKKKPQNDTGVAFKRGANACEPEPNEGTRQLRCMLSDHGHESTENKEHDLSGIRVLISEKIFVSHALTSGKCDTSAASLGLKD
jgi:putative DNA base modification enzyme with NMAD domain